MKKLESRDRQSLESDIDHHFGQNGYRILPQKAPQGSNTFSFNYLLEKNGETFLLKTVLLKKLKPGSLPQAKTEIEVCEKIRSQNTVSLIESKLTDNHAFLLFPYLKGDNLEEYAEKNSPLSFDEIQRIGIGLLRGISDVFREHGVIHQDIKPANIFICEDGRVLLLDFGTARYKQLSTNAKESAKGNNRFLSPEQIEGGYPGDPQASRVEITDKTDVFCAGMVLYSLIEGVHPFEQYENLKRAVLKGEPPRKMERQGIPSGLKKAVLKMMESNQYRRPSAREALAFLESGEVFTPVIEKGKFYYAATSGKLKGFVSYLERDPNTFDGIVIGASSITKDNATLRAIKFRSKETIVDPETYLFSCPDDSMPKRFKALPYVKDYKDLTKDAELLQKISEQQPEVKNFINAVFEFQEELSNFIVPPFFYIAEYNKEEWDIDKAITNLSLQIYEEKALTKPLIKGLAISSEVLTSEKTRNKLLNSLTNLYDIAGYYVVLEEPSNKETTTDTAWLKGAKHLLTTLLATGKTVIWGRADIVGLAFSTFGLSISIGEARKQRKMNFVESSGGGGERPKFFYVSELFSRLKWPTAIQALDSSGSYSVNCSKECCEHVDFRSPSSREEGDLNFHHILCFRSQWERYSQEGMGQFIVDVKKADEIFGEIKRSRSELARNAVRKDAKPNSQAFLTSWKELFSID